MFVSRKFPATVCERIFCWGFATSARLHVAITAPAWIGKMRNKWLGSCLDKVLQKDVNAKNTKKKQPRWRCLESCLNEHLIYKTTKNIWKIHTLCQGGEAKLGNCWGNVSNSGSINLELQHIATRMGRVKTRYWKHLTRNKTHRQSRDEQ